VVGICARHTAPPFTAMSLEKMIDVEAILAEYQSESGDTQND
jgi:hypothetical protein